MSEVIITNTHNSPEPCIIFFPPQKKICLSKSPQVSFAKTWFEDKFQFFQKTAFFCTTTWRCEQQKLSWNGASGSSGSIKCIYLQQVCFLCLFCPFCLTLPFSAPPNFSNNGDSAGSFIFRHLNSLTHLKRAVWNLHSQSTHQIPDTGWTEFFLFPDLTVFIFWCFCLGFCSSIVVTSAFVCPHSRSTWTSLPVFHHVKYSVVHYHFSK